MPSIALCTIYKEVGVKGSNFLMSLIVNFNFPNLVQNLLEDKSFFIDVGLAA